MKRLDILVTVLLLVSAIQVPAMDKQDSPVTKKPTLRKRISRAMVRVAQVVFDEQDIYFDKVHRVSLENHRRKTLEANL